MKTSSKNNNDTDFLIMNNARKIIHSDFKKNWTLDSMAKLTCYSVRHFIFLYKKLYKKTPVDDLIDQRINMAKFMLNNEVMPLSKIAFLCGFNSPYYFSRIFKQRTGFSPTDYKKTLSKDTSI